MGTGEGGEGTSGEVGYVTSNAIIAEHIPAGRERGGGRKDEGREGGRGGEGGRGRKEEGREGGREGGRERYSLAKSL